MANIVLKLEVEQLRQTVIHAFSDRQQEIQDAIAVSLDRFLDAFSFQEAVEREADNILRSLVNRTMTEAISSVLCEAPIEAMIRAAAINKVRHAIEVALKND
jgi:hypothetical protein